MVQWSTIRGREAEETTFTSTRASRAKTSYREPIYWRVVMREFLSRRASPRWLIPDGWNSIHHSLLAISQCTWGETRHPRGNPADPRKSPRADMLPLSRVGPKAIE